MTADLTTRAVETIQRFFTGEASLLDVARALEALGSVHELVTAGGLSRMADNQMGTAMASPSALTMTAW